MKHSIEFETEELFLLRGDLYFIKGMLLARPETSKGLDQSHFKKLMEKVDLEWEKMIKAGQVIDLTKDES